MNAPKMPVTEPKPKNPNSLFLTAQEARDILYSENEAFEVEVDEIIRTERWSVHHRLVVYNLQTSKYYMCTYSKGATENQDEQPWEYDKEVEFVQVEPYATTIIKYQIKL